MSNRKENLTHAEASEEFRNAWLELKHEVKTALMEYRIARWLFGWPK